MDDSPDIDLPDIDAHAHVWDKTCPFVADARHRPDYEATVDSYLGVLDAHGIARAVLVQPSFLGTDNRYLLDCLRVHTDRLRGIVVLDPQKPQDRRDRAITDAALDDMTAAGVIGLRYNLIGRDTGAIAEPSWRALTRRATARGWWIEVQAEGADWPRLLDTLLADGARIMVDHFGKPSGPRCLGHAALMATDPARHCVKLSAPYRQAPADMVPYANAFLDTWGAARCLWGSDWPWTQHEGRHGYADTQAWLAGWAGPRAREGMARAAAGLTGFTKR